ncbi:MAG: hypothetical protein QXG01_04675 [Candidatus Bathyarchaeia archaeon]
MSADNKFNEDLEVFLPKISKGLNREAINKLIHLKERLIELHSKGLVKINHSIMELLCAKHLICDDYNVKLEFPLDQSLICDLYAVKGDGSLIVEIETGFIPPEHALDPTIYTKARIVSKISRYSQFADKFAVGIPPYYVLQFPMIFAMPPRIRDEKRIREMKNLCDIYYKNPPISLKEIQNARLHTIYIVDVDAAKVIEIDPESYYSRSESLHALAA